MIASNGKFSRYTTVDKSTSKSLADIGFTNDEIKSTDHIHISVVKYGAIRYWYNGATPTATQGHPIWEGDERIIRGITNARNFKIIADNDALSDVEVAITLGSF